MFVYVLIFPELSRRCVFTFLEQQRALKAFACQVLHGAPVALFSFFFSNKSDSVSIQCLIFIVNW